MIKNKFRWIPPILWGVLIAILSLIPGGTADLNFLGIPHFDKIGHFGMYAIWTFLFVKALQYDTVSSYLRAMWIAIIIGALTGILLECGQYFMRFGRSFEIWDMVANTAGAFVGAWIGKKIRPSR
jgi:VanZ family protein